jgi:hypothetical protein
MNHRMVIRAYNKNVVRIIIKRSNKCFDMVGFRCIRTTFVTKILRAYLTSVLV